jgi:hypothetical protein
LINHGINKYFAKWQEKIPNIPQNVGIFVWQVAILE